MSREGTGTTRCAPASLLLRASCTDRRCRDTDPRGPAGAVERGPYNVESATSGRTLADSDRFAAWVNKGAVRVLDEQTRTTNSIPLTAAGRREPQRGRPVRCLLIVAAALLAGCGGESAEDKALGTMTPPGTGKLCVSHVTLDPDIVFSGEKRPTPAPLAELHPLAHRECFIAHSVITEVVVAGIPSH